MVLHHPQNFESSSGIGVRGIVSGHRIALGNTALMEAEKIDWHPLADDAERLRQEGASDMYLAADNQMDGLVAVSDPIKKTTPEALETLKNSGLIVIMATGDGWTTARSGAAKLGISQVYGEVKPQDNLALVEQLQAEGFFVVFVGVGFFVVFLLVFFFVGFV